MRVLTILIIFLAPMTLVSQLHAGDDKTVAVIGTGDMGNSIGPKLAQIGYRVVYGSRNPDRDIVRNLVSKTASNASATTQREAAQSADIVILAVGWPAMEQVAQNLGNLDGKIIVDVSLPLGQADDGYPILTVETSSAEMIQAWNPGSKVVKWGLPTAHYIDAPIELGHKPSNLVAADDRSSKELVMRIAHAIGQDPFDAGPLRMSRAIEAQALLFMVPLYQRRTAHWENVTIRSSYWSCYWQDDWSMPVVDADNLATFPDHEQPLKNCSEYPSNR